MLHPFGTGWNQFDSLTYLPEQIKGRPIQQWEQLACTSNCGCKRYVDVVYNVRVVSLWVTPGQILSPSSIPNLVSFPAHPDQTLRVTGTQCPSTAGKRAVTGTQCPSTAGKLRVTGTQCPSTAGKRAVTGT